MQNSLHKKTIFVTGADGIIGSEVCVKALEKGANVAACDWTFNKLESIKNTLPYESQERLLFLSCDLRSKEQIQDALHKTLARWNTIDGLHNNAAWKSSDLKKFFVPFETYSLETWHEVFSVNVDGAMLVDQVIGSHMAHAQHRGSIVHTASIYGIVGPDPRIYAGSEYMGMPINTPAVYAASKGAMLSLTSYLATYWGAKGVRVNCITPGGVESGQNDVFIRNYSEKVPLGRMAKASEIANAVLFLLSDESSYMNGHNLVVDGGFTKW